MHIYSDISEVKHPDKSDINLNFKLVVFTELSAQLPINFTKNSKKYGFEYKKTLKEKMKECFEYTKEEDLNSNQKKLVFALAMMHGMLINRVKYSFITWSSTYKYTKHMFECGSSFLLENYDIENPNLEQILIPFCDSSYGGIIKDASDLTTLYSISRNYLNEKIFGNKYAFSSSEVYVIPENPSIDSMSQQISLMPELEYGDLYNEGEFESVHFEKLHSDKIRSTFIKLIEVEITHEIDLMKILGDIANSLPPLIKESEYCETIKEQLLHLGDYPIALHFSIEIFKINTLIQTLSNEIVTLSKHIESQELIRDDIRIPLLNSEVPKLWRALSFPSSLSITHWLKSLNEKAQYLRQYLHEGASKTYYLGGMINPFSFMSAVRLYQMKKKQSYMFLAPELTSYESAEDIPKAEDIFYISGLLMIRGRTNEGVLDDPLPGQESAKLPLVALKFLNEETRIEGMYECPVFLTQYRENTGDVSNFLMTVRCPTFAFSDYWAVKGVAILCGMQ
jgi:hypothetical protein